MGKLIDASSRFPQHAVQSQEEQQKLLAPPAPAVLINDDAPASTRQLLGERHDGAIDLAAWRAKWQPVFTKEFAINFPDGSVEPEGDLRFFHDQRSNSLEFFASNHDGSVVRHVLEPVDAMKLLLALNSAYGFDPQGPDGTRLSETPWVSADGRSPWDDGPMTA